MVESKVIRINNSLYVNIPADEARALNLREGAVVDIDVRPVLTVGSLVGALHGKIKVAPIDDAEMYPEEFP